MLPGFSTFERNGVELPTSFTATVNAEMKLGSIAETITVSGEAPVVDVHTATQSQQTTATKPSSAGQAQQTPASSQRKSKKHHKRHAKAKKTTTTKPQSR